ncbi:MAG: hypothetical protein BWZ02_01320 [Lentisphaerae bacterium ADurb.BinA184]|nr:MAG: hypothetical protein BWZ02_01320 [Lentisphaerae bacterium ADurb.BinA184]
MANPLTDKELEQYRNLLETPTEYKDGFGWSTVVGILFCGLIMLPGSIYLSLMTGGGMGSAATWVTLILFSEVARRALKPMSKQNLVVLLYAVGIIMSGGPIGEFVYRAFLVTSDAVRDAGMRDAFPSWFVPKPDSPAILERNLFHRDWLVPIGLAFFMTVIGFLNKYTIGYFFFRLTSDVERLPFPMAPVSAQGIMAMAETDDRRKSGGTAAAAGADDEVSRARAAYLRGRGGERPKSQRWRLFTLGSTIGVLFGLIQVGVPAISAQPFVDTTTLTESILPATPTGFAFDAGIILTGMVLPFWAIVGSFIAIASTLVVNPILQHTGILTRWQPGMDTINTSFSNSIDFWMSFGIGAAVGIAAISIYQTVRDVARRMREVSPERADRATRSNLWKTPALGRGDYPMWLALGGYCLASVAQVTLCYILLKDTGTNRLAIVSFLFVFTFLYNPFISYVNARLLGIAGQQVDIPFVRETAFIVSGAKGIDIWLAPIPIANYGGQAQSFRVNELTGVSFRSLIKIDMVTQPTMFLFSILFWAFIWHSSAIPSEAFPAAQINWNLRSKNDALLYSSTFAASGTGGSIKDSEFMQAIHPKTIGAGCAVTVAAFTTLNALNLPTLMVYGMIRGLGQLPHYMCLEIVGALLGRFYFQKKFGRSEFLRMAPTVMAGYFTGVGLISMATIAVKLIQSAVSAAPF